MRPGQFLDRPTRPMPHAFNKNCVRLRTSSHAVFKIQRVNQMQADYNQSDSASPAYIKNKPQVVNADFAEENPASPSYIFNKPTVVQADFQCSDSTSPSYIRNKPDLSKLSFQGSDWDQGETIQDQSTTGFFWGQGQ